MGVHVVEPLLAGAVSSHSILFHRQNTHPSPPTLSLSGDALGN